MKKVGILGGGQLGRMLLQAAANYSVQTYVLESSADCPAAHLCTSFTKGDIRNEDDVFNFGKDLDAVTIEIESVSVEGLRRLRDHGIKVFPSPEALEIIRDKVVQKKFYASYDIPTAPFVITHSKEDIRNNASLFPAVHKSARGGYDGRGVQILEDPARLENAFEGEAVLEKKIDVQKEIAIIIAIDQNKKTAIYPPSEMIFDPVLNLLEYQLSPAVLMEKTLWKVEAIGLSVAQHLNCPGIFAVELLLDREGNVFVNETAPRVHNSGHHTIEGNYSSQFDMLWRVILNLPLGNTKAIMNSALINLIGQNTETIDENSTALKEILKIENAFLHLYGKKESRPGRKMGHVTILDPDRVSLVHLANKIRNIWEGKYQKM